MRSAVTDIALETEEKKEGKIFQHGLNLVDPTGRFAVVAV